MYYIKYILSIYRPPLVSGIIPVQDDFLTLSRWAATLCQRYYVRWYLQLSPLDLHDNSGARAVHQAKPIAEFGGQASFHAQCVCEFPKPDQTHAQSCAIPLPQPDLSKSAWVHHLHKEIPIAKHDCCQVTHGEYSARQDSEGECHSVLHGNRQYYIRKQRHFHHCGEAQYGFRLQKPGLFGADLLRQVDCSVLLGKIWTDTSSPKIWGWMYRSIFKKKHKKHRNAWRLSAQGTWVYEIPSSKGGMSHCPKAAIPQATALPSLRSSTVWHVPAETWVYDIPTSNGGMSHCPASLFPQVATLPSLRRRIVCLPPAETSVYIIFSSKGGMLHWPQQFFPQATALPSLRRSTVWSPPAETWV